MKDIYVKDLSKLGRDLKNVIIVDNNPDAYLWHKENAIPIRSWYDDQNDCELKDLIPILQKLAKVEDVRKYIPRISKNRRVDSQRVIRTLNVPKKNSPLSDIWNAFKDSIWSKKEPEAATPSSKENKTPKKSRGKFTRKSTPTHASSKLLSIDNLFQSKPAAVKVVPKVQVAQALKCQMQTALKPRKLRLLNDTLSSNLNDSNTIIDDVSEQI